MSDATTVEFVHPDLLIEVWDDGGLCMTYGWVRVLDGQHRVVSPGVGYPLVGLIRPVMPVDYMLPGWPEEGQ